MVPRAETVCLPTVASAHLALLEHTAKQVSLSALEHSSPDLLQQKVGAFVL